MNHKCQGCKFCGTHQEMMFKPFGVCYKENDLVKAEKAYNAKICPYGRSPREQAEKALEARR